MSAEASVLFDAPGPKARRRYAVIAAIGTLAILALLYLLVRALAAKGQFTAAKWSPFIDPVTWTSYLLPGLRATLVAAFFSIILAMIGGILLGHGPPVSAGSSAGGLLVSLWSSSGAVPVLMMMLFAYYVFLFGIGVSGDILPLLGVIAGLTFYNSCVIAEPHPLRSRIAAKRSAGGCPGHRADALRHSATGAAAASNHDDAAFHRQPACRRLEGLGPRVPDLAIRSSSCSGQTLASLKGNLIPTFLVVATIFIIINYLLTRLASLPGTPAADPATRAQGR